MQDVYVRQLNKDKMSHVTLILHKQSALALWSKKDSLYFCNLLQQLFVRRALYFSEQFQIAGKHVFDIVNINQRYK